MIIVLDKKGVFMRDKAHAVGVVVIEPTADLRTTLCEVAKKVWGTHEVLPRATGREFLLAFANLNIAVVVVRSSIMHALPEIHDCLAELSSTGSQIIILQEGANEISNQKWVDLGRLYFLSGFATKDSFSNLMRLALVKHCMPDLT